MTFIMDRPLLFGSEALHCTHAQTMFLLPIAINRAEYVCATVMIRHNYMLMCNHTIVINIRLCLLTVLDICMANCLKLCAKLFFTLLPSAVVVMLR